MLRNLFCLQFINCKLLQNFNFNLNYILNGYGILFIDKFTYNALHIGMVDEIKDD